MMTHVYLLHVHKRHVCIDSMSTKERGISTKKTHSICTPIDSNRAEWLYIYDICAFTTRIQINTCVYMLQIHLHTKEHAIYTKKTPSVCTPFFWHCRMALYIWYICIDHMNINYDVCVYTENAPLHKRARHLDDEDTLGMHTMLSTL